MNETEIILESRNVDKFFYQPVEFQALDDVNLKVREGEFLAIIGESGSGKSTLLYILATLDTQYGGELYFRGKPLHTKTRSELARFRLENLGFIFQFHYLLSEFSVRENIMLPAGKLGKRGKAENESYMRELLEKFDVLQTIDKRADRLSGGQQQRIAVARALINRPAVVFADEPTGNLDSENSRRVLDIFRELADEQNQTIIAVTHDMKFAQRADRVIRMLDGRIIEEIDARTEEVR